MSYNIRLHSRQVDFCCGAGQTILQAAIQANILMPHGCRAGQCGRCKHRVVEGSYRYGAEKYDAIDDEELKQGLLLCCQAIPTSDMIIDSL